MSHLITSFNRFLDESRTLDEPLSTTIDDEEELGTMPPNLANVFTTKLQHDNPVLKIYYPISRYDELAPVSVLYDVSQGASVKDLMESFQNVYKAALAPDNIAAYLEADPLNFAFLNDEPNPTLLFVMSGLVFIEGLEPYEDGWILQLGS